MPRSAAYGEHVGLAFQIVDDILDVEESSEALGKTAGKDAQQQKITFPAVYGLAESKRMAEDELRKAHAALEIFGTARAALARVGRPDRPAQGVMKARLDVLLAERGLAESREKAQALVLAGEVLVNGVKAHKAGQSVPDGAVLEVLQRARATSAAAG